MSKHHSYRLTHTCKRNTWILCDPEKTLPELAYCEHCGWRPVTEFQAKRIYPPED